MNQRARIIMVDSRPYCAHGEAVWCEAPLTVLSLALPSLPSVIDSSVSAAPMPEVL